MPQTELHGTWCQTDFHVSTPPYQIKHSNTKSNCGGEEELKYLLSFKQLRSPRTTKWSPGNLCDEDALQAIVIRDDFLMVVI